MKNKYIGSNFDEFLQEEGLLAETKAAAIKRVIAYQARPPSLSHRSSLRRGRLRGDINCLFFFLSLLL